jgi:hypothetical protein
MSLLNYTTEVPAYKTVSEIQHLLATHGAKAILHEYDDNGYIIALSFKIVLGKQEIAFRLPTDWRPILQILEHDPQARRRIRPSEEQALRVAWRIVKDWVEAQLAIVETRMVSLDQVFLPYAITKDGKTLYEKAKDEGFFLPPGQDSSPPQ